MIKNKESITIRSHLKNRILVQDRGGAEVQPAGILKYSEELKRRPNTEIGPKDFFEIASRNMAHNYRLNELFITLLNGDLSEEQRTKIQLG